MTGCRPIASTSCGRWCSRHSGTARSLEAGVAAKHLTHEEAFARLRDQLHAIRFDDGAGYITVQAPDGMILVHGAEPVRENAISTAKDASGVSITSLIATALAGHDDGTISYLFSRPGQTDLLPKVSYVARFAPWNVVFLAGAYTDDLDAAFRSALLHLTLAGGGILVVTLAAGWFVNRDITASLGRLRQAMASLSAGDLSVIVPGTDRGDEAGAMARAVEVFKDNAARIEALQAATAEVEARAATDRRAALLELADRFDREVRGVVDQVAASGAGLSSGLGRLASDASNATAEVGRASADAGDATRDVQSVAAAMEQMAASGLEISRQVTRAAEVAGNAAEEGRRTNACVAGLAAAAQKVGDVVQLIQDIARTDESTRAQRDDRGGAGRRRGKRLRGRGRRGEEPRQPDRTGDRGHPRADHRDPVGNRLGAAGDRHDLAHRRGR